MKTLVLLITAMAVVSSTAAAQTAAEGPPVVVTVGEGVVKRAPDQAWVTIAAESRAKTPAEAQKINADAMAAVMQKLKSVGLPADAIKTSAYELRPEFDYANNRQTLRGYVARNAVEVRVDELPKLGQVLDVAVSAGATSVGGVRFDLKDRSAAERAAVEQAVADARTQATAAAQAAGMKVERVQRLEVNTHAPIPPPRPVPMRMEMAASSGEPPISPGELEIRATVTLTSVMK